MFRLNSHKTVNINSSLVVFKYFYNLNIVENVFFSLIYFSLFETDFNAFLSNINNLLKNWIVTLLNLLSFPTEIKPDTDRYRSLLTYLDELLSVSDEQSAEIVKFLQAILDKLIDILLDLKIVGDDDTNNKPAYEMHRKQIQPRVFEILVVIFQIIDNQSKFASFRTVIDAYLSKNFCITLAHKPLLRIFMEVRAKTKLTF